MNSPVAALTCDRGPRLLCWAFMLAVYGSEQCTPRCMPLVDWQSVKHNVCDVAKNPCLSQLMPSCSKRVDPSTVLSRYMFWPITGWSGVVANQSSQQVPMLQD